ncbi:MAG: hypothetical protein LBB52_07600 [Desulfovibrio sp.]|jgi:hypothetical protein|nr:hypothetical protein [Desulfovibrio sp.]
MIVNIHGFTGSGDNTKYRWLRENFPQRRIFSPTFDYVAMSPENILGRLADGVSSYLAAKPPIVPALCVLGSGMGAFFARCLNLMFPEVTTVLINPALAPFLTLRGHIDCRAYLGLFARLAYKDDGISAGEGELHVIIGDSDELINHELLTKPLLPPAFNRFHLIRGGTHRLELTPEVGVILKSILG